MVMNTAFHQFGKKGEHFLFLAINGIKELASFCTKAFIKTSCWHVWLLSHCDCRLWLAPCCCWWCRWAVGLTVVADKRRWNRVRLRKSAAVKCTFINQRCLFENQKGGPGNEVSYLWTVALVQQQMHGWSDGCCRQVERWECCRGEGEPGLLSLLGAQFYTFKILPTQILTQKNYTQVLPKLPVNSTSSDFEPSNFLASTTKLKSNMRSG